MATSVLSSPRVVPVNVAGHLKTPSHRRFQEGPAYKWLWIGVFALLCLMPGVSRLSAQSLVANENGTQPKTNGQDIYGKSLEQLMNLKITSVSRREEKFSRTPAAILVITQEDIKRSGATSVPGLLRMVPGVDVARIMGDRWAISIRGFNDVYSSKLLVLIDGRTVYTPGFSGVYWNQLDVPLDDIERIEVIRGPGGTAWGANAVNGVINIITKNSKETQGTTLKAAAGSEKGVVGDLQNGGKISYYRAFAR
jgi:iron complex outermembrane receptor protein